MPFWSDGLPLNMGSNQDKVRVVVDDMPPSREIVAYQRPVAAEQTVRKKRMDLFNMFKFKKLVPHDSATAPRNGPGMAVAGSAEVSPKFDVAINCRLPPPLPIPSSPPERRYDGDSGTYSRPSTSTPTNSSLVVECRDITRNSQSTRVREHIDPKVTNNYVIEALIGKGSFSRVIRAVRRGTGDSFAVKMVPAKHGTGPFENELSILARVSHPFVIRLSEVYRTPSRVYMVMELASGGELYDRIVAKGRFSEQETMRTMQMLLNGLDYLHRIGITHRDLKPENLLYIRPRPDSRLLITDFGLAHMQTSRTTRGMTETCGTPEYIAPEVLLRQRYSNRVDMWAVGVIGYILLSGIMPFDDDCRTRLYRQIIRGKYYFYPEFWSDVSNEAKSFVASLLETDPDERLSAQEALCHYWIKAQRSPPPSSPRMMYTTNIPQTPLLPPPPPPPPQAAITYVTAPPSSPQLHNGYHGPPATPPTPSSDRPTAHMERTRSTRSIRSLARSDHGHRVDPKEVEKLAKDPEVRRWLSRPTTNRRTTAHSDYGTMESSKDYGLF